MIEYFGPDIYMSLKMVPGDGYDLAIGSNYYPDELEHGVIITGTLAELRAVADRIAALLENPPTTGRRITNEEAGGGR